MAKGMRERQRKKKKHIRRPMKRKMTPDQIYTILGNKTIRTEHYLPKGKRSNRDAQVHQHVEDQGDVNKLLREGLDNEHPNTRQKR